VPPGAVGERSEPVGRGNHAGRHAAVLARPAGSLPAGLRGCAWGGVPLGHARNIN
jgi:hypothetical protein